MIRSIFKITIAALVIFTTTNAFALRYMGSNGGGGGDVAPPHPGDSQQGQVRAAACAPATGLRDLEWNNVRARIETGGSMWQDRANNRAAYEIPKVNSEEDESISSIYSGALWLGGLSPDQQLKLAAVTFRGTGNDFWPGPLTNDGTAEVTESTCEAYDQFYVSLRQDAQRHRQYYDLVTSGASAEAIALIFPDGYTIPTYFFNYPAHGNTAAGQDYYLAPFYDYPGSNPDVYDPENGDYPWYDFLREIDCAQRKREDVVPLFGDQTFYWIFNDKGNVHTESQGQPIGMEIRAQAFAFTTNDEVNNMTFLNYVLINQGTQTLTNTYFGSWVDSDLGNSTDDYVGCDVKRGLGYCYNGDNDDQSVSTSPGYGENPPAVGVDFFEGPYQDEDLIDNPLTTNIIHAADSLGIPYKGLGIGYGDTIIDNERFGMRKFVYYNIANNPINGDPTTAVNYYGYLRGFWKNGAEMLCGGNGVSGAGVIQGLPCDYMFPGDSDPLHWGTDGTEIPLWTEEEAGNGAGDRRFIQSAGPFTLQPGDYNNITVGVVWARTTSGGQLASIDLMREADDKAQSLFDNCFELVSGPDAPDVTVQELNREIILMLSNENSISNNYKEKYSEFDPGIPDSLSDGTVLSQSDRSYGFEGYLVYQLANAQVGSNDLGDIEKARLIAQCDVINGIENIINYYRDPIMGLIVPTLMVQGTDSGIDRSFRVTDDAFATGSSALINHKTYYFMVIAYGYNNYQPYDVAQEKGQDESYIASRKGAVGEVPVIRAIPHTVSPEAGGTISQSVYGQGIPLTRLEGKGSGTNELFITPQSESDILANSTTNELHYLPGGGPVNVKVVDPLRVQAVDFQLALIDSVDENDLDDDNIEEWDPDSMFWELTDLTNNEKYTTYTSFNSSSEDVLIDYGISISWGQYQYFNEDGAHIKSYTDLISSTLEYDDASRPWYIGIPDVDGLSEMNWIRAGTLASASGALESEATYDDYAESNNADFPFTDAEENYEGVLGGTWSPYCLAGFSHEITENGATAWFNSAAPVINALEGDLSTGLSTINAIKGLNNVDIVFTADKSKWTRCAVLEMQPAPGLTTNAWPGYEAQKMMVRSQASVDKNGKRAGQDGYNSADGDLTSNFGMGWFPGYAIDLGTGDRLNMAFGEDSWLVGENGRDMVWNPSGRLYSDIGTQALFGGQHWIYVFKNAKFEEEGDEDYVDRYDQGAFIHQILSNSNNFSQTPHKRVFQGCTWIGSAMVNPEYPLLSPEQGLIPNNMRIRLRVASTYERYSNTQFDLDETGAAQNGFRPLYTFTTKGMEAITADQNTLTSVLDIINVVPNPYYAFSSYETSKLDNRVKITNVPEVCTITIYDLNGTLVRQFNKADPMTSLDWDLKNHKNIPIASGTYIIHVEVPNVGEKILKWFGVMRPVDLDNF
ncbi:MAG: T9SS type A sorting domain-containing protein [Flavobacteriales bacterium]